MQSYNDNVRSLSHDAITCTVSLWQPKRCTRTCTPPNHLLFPKPRVQGLASNMSRQSFLATYSTRKAFLLTDLGDCACLLTAEQS